MCVVYELNSKITHVYICFFQVEKKYLSAKLITQTEPKVSLLLSIQNILHLRLPFTLTEHSPFAKAVILFKRNQFL